MSHEGWEYAEKDNPDVQHFLNLQSQLQNDPKVTPEIRRIEIIKLNNAWRLPPLTVKKNGAKCQ